MVGLLIRKIGSSKSHFKIKHNNLYSTRKKKRCHILAGHKTLILKATFTDCWDGIHSKSNLWLIREGWRVGGARDRGVLYRSIGVDVMGRQWERRVGRILRILPQHTRARTSVHTLIFNVATRTVSPAQRFLVQICYGHVIQICMFSKTYKLQKNIILNYQTILVCQIN